MAHTPPTQDRCPHRVSPSASEPPECRVLLKMQCQWSFTEVCSRFNFYLHPKIHNHAKLSHYRYTATKICIHLNPKFPLFKLMIEISFVLSYQKIVMQHFVSYNRYSILITVLWLIKNSYPSSHSSPTLFPSQDSRNRH